MPTTTRSGRLKSEMAAPSRRNSGLETTAKSASGRTRRMMASISSPVPTGTVDLVTTTVNPEMRRAISSAAAYTYDKSAWPSPRLDGVPTAMNTASASRIAVSAWVVNNSLCSAILV